MRQAAQLVSLLGLCHASAMKVLVTGAGGRTGSLVFQKLKNDYSVATPMGLVRSKKAVKKLQKGGATQEEIRQGDTMSSADLASAMVQCSRSPCAIIAL